MKAVYIQTTVKHTQMNKIWFLPWRNFNEIQPDHILPLNHPIYNKVKQINTFNDWEGYGTNELKIDHLFWDEEFSSV